MIAVDDRGCRLQPSHSNPLAPAEQRFPGIDEDSLLRSAGRTGLVYRLISMSRFQNGISEFYRVLANSPKPEVSNLTTVKAQTDEATRQQLIDVCTRFVNQAKESRHSKFQDFAPFVTVRRAVLLEHWVEMETSSFLGLLVCLACYAFMTGELNRGFSAADLVDNLRTDTALRQQSPTIAYQRDREHDKLLSAFIKFDRGLGYSVAHDLGRKRKHGANEKKPSPPMFEATGAPLLLTTAITTDGCKMFVEKMACGMMGFFVIPQDYNHGVVMMLQTADRLAQCDQNEYRLSKKSGKTNETQNLGGQDDGVGRSISQIGVMFINEMAEAIQRWKFCASLKRRPGYLTTIRTKGEKHATFESVDKAAGRRGSSGGVEGDGNGRDKQDQQSVFEGNSGKRPTFSSPLSQQPFGMETTPVTQLYSSPLFPTTYSQQQLHHHNPQQQSHHHQPSAFNPTNGLLNGIGSSMYEIPLFDTIFDSIIGNTDLTNQFPWFEPFSNPP